MFGLGEESCVTVADGRVTTLILNKCTKLAALPAAIGELKALTGSTWQVHEPRRATGRDRRTRPDVARLARLLEPRKLGRTARRMLESPLPKG